MLHHPSLSLLLGFVVVAATRQCDPQARAADAANPVRITDQAVPLPPESIGGLLGDRLQLWRQHRLERVGTDPFLLEGFQSPPGSHPWQGEHVGKWLHAATLAYAATHDERIGALLRKTVKQLVDAQQANGYLGTYAPAKRFFNPDDRGAKWSWDVWTHRYLLYGLLVYDRHCHDPEAVNACVRMGDLLYDSFGPGRRDVTELGTRHGLSSAVLLESIMMLYERTGTPRFLQFAQHIVECIEHNPHLRLGAAMRGGEDVSVPGDGKAYQLMATLLGYGELYRCTRRREYLEPVLIAWEKIRAEHLYVTGGPWSFKSDETKNPECFAPPSFFHPTNCVETCSTTTWIQLSLLLWRITGETRFAREAERALLNHLIGAQSPNGNDWAYFTMLNQPDRGYRDDITCCASSGPRALELFARHLVGKAGDALVVNSYLPVSCPLKPLTGGPGKIIVKGNYPFASAATVRFDIPGPVELTVDWGLPCGAESIEIKVDGKRQTPRKTETGYYRLARKWTSSNKIEVSFTFPLMAHVKSGRDGVRWVAFSRGPIVLAQEITAQSDQPQVVLPIQGKTVDASEWLEPVEASVPRRGKNLRSRYGKVPVYRLRVPTHRNVFLIPYYLAGATGGPVRTMFPIASSGS